MPSSRRHRTSVDYEDADSSSDDDEYHRRRPSRPRGYRPRVQREDSLLKREAEPEKADSGWDTDYDPKDKYYLSADDDPFDLYSPERKTAPSRGGRSRDRRSPSAGPVADRGTSPARGPSHAARPRARSHHHHHHHPHHHARPHSPARAGHARPRAARAGSSYRGGASRPRPRRAGSSSHAGARGPSDRDPSSRRRAGDGRLHRLLEDFPWEEAGKVALQAGAVAAIKVGTDSVPWPVKGTKIASAALGAAVVDHVLKPKKKGGVKYAAMRHMAEVAMGSMVVGPALGKASGGRGGGGGGGGGGRKR